MADSECDAKENICLRNLERFKELQKLLGAKMVEIDLKAVVQNLLCVDCKGLGGEEEERQPATMLTHGREFIVFPKVNKINDISFLRRES